MSARLTAKGGSDQPIMVDKQQTIALVVPALELGGGVPTMAGFLYDIIHDSGRYRPDLISLATSARDEASVRLLVPGSWMRGPQVIQGVWRDKPFRHIGACFTEFEFQRYRPRHRLTEILETYDLIQVVSGTPAVAAAALAAQRPVCAFVATTVEQERQTLIAWARGWRRAWLRSMTRLHSVIERRVLPNLSHVFAESEYTYQLLRGLLPAERLSIGVPGVDTELFSPGMYRENGYILSVGRFADPRKNVRLLFRAYDRLRQLIPDVPKLILAGKNTLNASDWEVAVSLGLCDYIEVRHDVSMGELAELYRNASLFVLSSTEEGLGIVILEAMASGIPVISTRCGGPETAVVEGVTGCLTPVGDPEALAQRMRELLENAGLRQQMGRAGRKRVAERFSLATAGRVYLEKYDELLSDEA